MKSPMLTPLEALVVVSALAALAFGSRWIG